MHRKTEPTNLKHDDGTIQARQPAPRISIDQVRATPSVLSVVRFDSNDCL